MIWERSVCYSLWCIDHANCYKTTIIKHCTYFQFCHQFNHKTNRDACKTSFQQYWTHWTHSEKSRKPLLQAAYHQTNNVQTFRQSFVVHCGAIQLKNKPGCICKFVRQFTLARIQKAHPANHWTNNAQKWEQETFLDAFKSMIWQRSLIQFALCKSAE